MTVAQIAAIISLLLAFNVPQATVNNVQAILQNTKMAQTAPAQTTLPTTSGAGTSATTTTANTTYPVVGKDIHGNDVYRGTGTFTIDPITKCQKAVALIDPVKSLYSVGGRTTYCPKD